MTTRKQIIGILGLTLVLTTQGKEVWADCTSPSGYTCVCDSGQTRKVCAKWSQGAPPESPGEFEVNYTCDGCSDAPRVTFKAGDLGWEVYSEVNDGSGTAANLGNLVLPGDVEVNTDNFGVSLQKPSALPAANVSSIVLDSADASWTGYSSITGATLISGNLSGALTLVEDSSGNGGEVSATVDILGNALGNITIPKLKANLTINGNIGSASQAVTVDVDEIYNATLRVNGSVLNTSTLVDIGDFVPASGQTAVFTSPAGGSFEGKLLLQNGLPEPSGATTAIYLSNLIGTSGVTGSGTIDLNNGNVVGYINVNGANAYAKVINGGDVVSGGIVYLAYFSTNTWAGTATFANILQGGELGTVTYGNLSGTWTITGDVAGVVEVAGELQSNGKIYVNDDVTSTGVVEVGKDAAGLIDVTDDMLGEIDVGQTLTASGKIKVGDLCDGDISIGRDTATGSMIELSGVGLDDFGSILVNTTNGNYNANGTIRVGPTTLPSPPNDITWDGCFEVAGPSGYGRLNGRIRITGCHSTSTDLNICYNSGGSGQVEIVDTGCTNQPVASCGACP